MNAMISTHALVKRYGRFTAVDGLDLDVRPGEIYGFLGPNGAGKTSTINMLLGLSAPTSGEVLLFGQPLRPERLELRRRIGVVPEKHPRGMWSWMTADEYLRYFADLFAVADAERRIGALLEQVDLAAVRNKRFHAFSRGMLQKLSICRALLHDPDILFLDEPISGLDPIGIKQVRDLILEESREGRTVFVSSHLLSEMEKICHRVGIIYAGKLVAEDEMRALLDRLVQERQIQIELAAVPDGLTERLRALPFVTAAVAKSNSVTVTVLRDGDHRHAVSSLLIEQGLVPLRIGEQGASLEDVFVTITADNVKTLTADGGAPAAGALR